MGKVIFNADDFGYSRGMNYAIVDSHRLGILTSTTLMAGMPGFDHAVSLAKENPDLGIGVHLTLTCGYPLLKTHETIVDEDGMFKKLSYFEGDNLYDIQEVYEEWDTQIKKVIDAGIKPTHLDSHHHVHSFPKQYEVIVELARKYNLPIRNNFEIPQDINHTSFFEPLFDHVGAEKEARIQVYLNNLIDTIQKHDSVEVMCHPGYLDYEIFEGSTLLRNRVNVTEFLIQSDFSKRLKEMENIELVNYSKL
ncbi:MAG: chitin disaccharide deacetylase [Erysipelothrix sp.]